MIIIYLAFKKKNSLVIHVPQFSRLIFMIAQIFIAKIGKKNVTYEIEVNFSHVEEKFRILKQ